MEQLSLDGSLPISGRCVKNPAAETAGRKSVKVKEKTIPSLEGRGLRGG
jgi:hypothetical protein